jgi:hypothetical protein
MGQNCLAHKGAQGSVKFLAQNRSAADPMLRIFLALTTALAVGYGLCVCAIAGFF